MHSALRPYVTSGLAIAGTSVIALAPLAPPAPAQGAAVTSKQVTQDVTLSARVVTINPSPQELKMGEQLNGTVCGGNGTPCYELEYAPIFTDGTGHLGFGVEALRKSLAGNLGEETTVFAFSEGATVASQWLEKHLEDPEAYPAPENLTFVVIGNPTRKYGGSLFLEPWTPSPYKVIDVARQYDPTADMHNPLNSLANLNAAIGFYTNHLGDGYKNVDLDDPTNIKWTEGNTEYVFVPAKTLPLVEPLRWLGLNQLADSLTGPLAYLVEQGYDRDDHINLPPLSGNSGTGATAAPNPFYAPINLLETIANIPFYAVQGTNRFAEAMRASGSWWVYTPTNVLGWDPANPEMTRAFVDFLVAIPSISGPLGEIADYWARANLPMSAGCSGFPPCDDPNAILSHMFTVQLWDLFAPEGYTYTSPVTPEYNPISENEGYWGQELGEQGDPVEWYGDTIHLEPFQELKSFWEHLQSEPEGIKTADPMAGVDAMVNLIDALMITWNPFVPQSSVWNPDMTPFAYLTRPFAKLLCPTCNAVDPFMPPSWEVGDPIPKGAYIPPSVKDQYDEDGNYVGTPIQGATADENVSTLNARFSTQTDEATEDVTEDIDEATEEKTDVVSTAVQDLLHKFDKAPVDETPVDETPVDETPVDETPVDEDADDEDADDEDADDEEQGEGTEVDADKDKAAAEEKAAEDKVAESEADTEKAEVNAAETDKKDDAKDTSTTSTSGSSGSGGGTTGNGGGAAGS